MIYKFSKEKYIFIIIFCGFILTLFLVPVSKILSDSPILNCKDFSYSIKNQCLNLDVYTFSFENKNTYDLVLKLQNDNRKYFIDSNSKVNVRFENFSKDNRNLFIQKKFKNDYIVCGNYNLERDFIGGC